MRTKVVSEIMLTLLLVSLSVVTLNTLSVEVNPVVVTEHHDGPHGNPEVVRASQGYLKGRGALHEVDLKDADWTSRRYLSEVGNEYAPSGLSVQDIEIPRSRFVPTYKWDSGRGVQWKDFAYVGEDSAELVIGVDNIGQNNYYDLGSYLRGNGGELVDSISIGNKIRAVVADVPFATLHSFVSKVEIVGLASYIEPNVRYEIDSAPNDPEWPKQWGPRKIQADWAWNTTMGDPSILVAVVDTGIDWDHPDLAANYVPLGYDWVNNDPDSMDDHGHGTHVAGTIAAVLNNNGGITGLAQIRIMAEKVMDQRGRGSLTDVAAGIVHAVDQGADIINLSLGSEFDSVLLHEVIRYAYEHDVLIIAAAGNTAWSLKHYPAAYEEAIAVSATDEFDKPAEFTNFGDWIDVAAPGVNIFSTIWNDSYGYMSGTSMATPHVSGVAALIWSRFPNMTRDQVHIQLERTADDLGGSGFDEFFGYGRVNARNAVGRVLPDDDILILEWNITRWTKPEDFANADATILNFGKSNQSNVAVQLLANGDMVDSALIDFLTSGKSTTINFAWNPKREGIFNVTMYVVPVWGEEIDENNAVSTKALVRIAEVIQVPRDFQTIKEAIDIASSGSTIYVASGLYYEHLVIYKSLKLVGEHPSTTFIDGNGTSTVIIAFSASNIGISGFTIQNSLKIWGRESFGIYIGYINGISIDNNVVRNNNLGICLDYSNANNITNNMILDNKGAGFILSSSNNNDITNNTALNNGATGIILEYSTNNTLRNNDAIGNWINFGVDGNSLPDFTNNIDSSNTVNGKPVYYWINQREKQVPADAGYVAVINSTGITVKTLNLTNNYEGLVFAYTTNSVVQNVNASNNIFGMILFHSDNNVVNDNTINNNWLGIGVLSNSTGNNLSNNTIDSREWLEVWRTSFLITQGIYIKYSNNNTVIENTVSNHNLGSISMFSSVNNKVIGNSVRNDEFLGIGLLNGSNNNTITGNSVANNPCGLLLRSSWNNIIYHNNLVKNTKQVFSSNSINTWDDGYPVGGNYWSNYTDVDLHSGSYQNETSSDGIWDHPYVIDDNNRDRYPLTPGDINVDRIIDIFDVVIWARAFGTEPGNPGWNPQADLYPDNVIDIFDGVIIAQKFGKTHR